MPNKCHAKCDGTDFFGTLIAAWLGASIAMGSCGSCDSLDDVEDKVDRLESTVTQDMSDVRRNMRELAHVLRTNLPSTTVQYVEQDLLPGRTYTINGQEYQLVPRIGDQGYQFVPIEQNQPAP